MSDITESLEKYYEEFERICQLYEGIKIPWDSKAVFVDEAVKLGSQEELGSLSTPKNKAVLGTLFQTKKRTMCYSLPFFRIIVRLRMDRCVL